VGTDADGEGFRTGIGADRGIEVALTFAAAALRLHRTFGVAVIAIATPRFQLDLAAVEKAAFGRAAAAYRRQQHDAHDLTADLDHRFRSPAALRRPSARYVTPRFGAWCRG
jgi:hypothetical protein